MDDDLSKIVRDCLDILDENIEAISDIGYELRDDLENELVPDLKLHQLYDVVEDAAESGRLRHAESSFAKRQA